MADKKEDKPKTFDVTKPGKTPAAATSRPIIVGHGPMMKDPMVSESNAKDSAMPTKITINKTPTDSSTKATAAGFKVIKPPSESVTDKPAPKDGNPVKTKVDVAEPDAEKPAQLDKSPVDKPSIIDKESAKADDQPTSPASDPKATAAPSSPESSETSDTKDEPPKNSGAAAIDVSAQQASQKKTKKELKAEEEFAEQTKKIISEGTYSLPISTKRSTALVRIILFVVFLALVGVVLAIDAEVLKPADFGLDIDLPFDFL